MPLPVAHSPLYDAGLRPGHRFPMPKYPALIALLGREGFLARGASFEPEPAPSSWLRLAHDAAYVDQVFAAAVPKPVERAIGFEVNARVALRARAAVAGTLLAARLALETGLALNAAGGSHHARRSGGAGFCTFNDVAVASLALLATGEAGRILIVDLDVHQGDGTAEILSGEPRAFTLSVHAEKNFPARKERSDMDVALPDGVRDDAYLETVAEYLPQALAAAVPDLVFYNAGVDVHEADRLGRLSLTDKGLERRERAVLSFFRERAIPVCGVIGGGYSTDIEALAERHATLFRVARDFSD